MDVPEYIQGDAYWPYRNGRDAAKEHFLAIAAELEDRAPDDALAKPEPELLTDERLIQVYQAAYQPAWERGEWYGCHVDGLRAVYGLAAPAQPKPEGHQAIAKRAIESCLAQRDEVLAAFIAKYGFQPEDVIQVEQRQPDGTSTWRIERRPGPKPEELRDEDLEATARAAEIQPEPGEVEELVRRLRDWQSVPLLEERERIATLLQQLSTITTEDLNND
jgi:hypothetical protein